MDKPHAIVVVSDMIFSSKITGTAQALGWSTQLAVSAKAALARLEEQNPACIIMDLAVSSLDSAALAEIVACSGESRTIAFGSHVEVDRLEAARDAGCDHVVPRSQFVEILPQLFKV